MGSRILPLSSLVAHGYAEVHCGQVTRRKNGRDLSSGPSALKSNITTSHASCSKGMRHRSLPVACLTFKAEKTRSVSSRRWLATARLVRPITRTTVLVSNRNEVDVIFPNTRENQKRSAYGIHYQAGRPRLIARKSVPSAAPRPTKIGYPAHRDEPHKTRLLPASPPELPGGR